MFLSVFSIGVNSADFFLSPRGFKTIEQCLKIAERLGSQEVSSIGDLLGKDMVLYSVYSKNGTSFVTYAIYIRVYRAGRIELEPGVELSPSPHF